VFAPGIIGAVSFIDADEAWVLPIRTLDDTVKRGPILLLPAESIRRIHLMKAKRKIATVKRARIVLKLGWRPHRQADLTPLYRRAMRTLVVLAKARPKKEREIICTDNGCRVLLSRYPRACLELLPEELLQFLFVFVTAFPVPAAWNTY
jgi:hypothetical protein